MLINHNTLCHYFHNIEDPIITSVYFKNSTTYAYNKQPTAAYILVIRARAKFRRRSNAVIWKYSPLSCAQAVANSVLPNPNSVIQGTISSEWRLALPTQLAIYARDLSSSFWTSECNLNSIVWQICDSFTATAIVVATTTIVAAATVVAAATAHTSK